MGVLSIVLRSSFIKEVPLRSILESEPHPDALRILPDG